LSKDRANAAYVTTARLSMIRLARSASLLVAFYLLTSAAKE